jgi:hypothetical protein
MGEGISAYRVLVGKPEGKRSLGRPRRRRENNIKWIFKKWVGGSMDCIDLLVETGSCESRNESPGCAISFSRTLLQVVSIRQRRLCLLFNKEEYVKLAVYVQFHLYFQIMTMRASYENRN